MYIFLSKCNKGGTFKKKKKKKTVSLYLLGGFEFQVRDEGTRNDDTSATEDCEKNIAQIISIAD